MVNHDADILKALQDIRVKLLDLSKRNRLLNFRNNRFCVRIVDELPSQVFDYLVRNGKSMTFLHLPQPDEPEEAEGETINRDANRINKEALRTKAAAAAGIDISDELPSPEEHSEYKEKKHTDNKLQTKLFMSELETRLRRIRSRARSLIEETGKNQLFLSMGFLQWKDREDSQEKYEAPLIMIPVEVERGRLDARTRCYSYKIRYTGEDLIPNLSLAEKLKRDGMILPDFEDREVVTSAGDADYDLDPDSYFGSVGKMASNRKGWEVSRKMVLGFFAFSKLLMYHDLNPDRWPNSSIIEHDLIRTLLGCEVESGTSDFSDDQNEKRISEYLPLVMNADGSQTEAILKALSGQSMVIQGPPGTGKSQTITNLISCFLNEGKSVLFVAEKMAALDVVHRNLKKVGLTDSCLELHSYKAKKKEVLDSLEKRSKLKFKNVKHLETETERLEKIQKSIGEYVELIKKPTGPNQESVFQIFGKVEILRDNIEGLPQEYKKSFTLSIDSIDSITNSEIEESKSCLETLSHFVRDIGIPSQSPWYGFTPIELYYSDDEIVVMALESVKEAIEALGNKFNKLAAEIGLSVNVLDLQLRQLEAVCELDPSKAPTDPLQDLFGQFLLSKDEKPWEELESLGSLVAEYNDKISRASELLSAPKDISEQKLDKIVNLLSDARSRSSGPISFKTARQVGSSCLKLRELLQEFQAMTGTHVEAGFPEPDTISKVRRLVKTDSLMRQMPTGISISSTDRLFTDSIRVLFTEVAEQGQRLKNERNHLGRTFALQDLCPTEELSEIRRVFRVMQGKHFAFLSPQFNRTKRTLLKFLRIRLKAKSPKIVYDLERLEQFLRDENSFANDPRYKETFGNLFEGIDTNWDSLRQIVMWITKLSDLIGSTDYAKKLARFPQDVDLTPDYVPPLIRDLSTFFILQSGRRSVAEPGGLRLAAKAAGVI